MPNVLLVCTANLCRSPIAEHLLRAQLAGRAEGWAVRSAGVLAQDGRELLGDTAAALRRRGVRVADDWRSHALDDRWARWSDLVLTATEEHAGTVVRRYPATARRCFPLGRFAALLELAGGTAPTDDVAPLIDAVVRARALTQPRSARQDDITDPLGGSPEVFDRCADRIEAALRAISTRIGVAHGQG